MRLLCGLGLALLQPGVHGLAPSFPWPRSITSASSRGSHRSPLGIDRRLAGGWEREGGAAGVRRQTKQSISDHSDKVTLYEEFSKYADKTAVAQDVIFEITSMDHFDDVVSRAAGADEASSDGYEDAQGNLRIPHKLLMVEIHAGWCRVCKGLQPKLLKLVTKHPEVLCCKINKTSNEELAGKLGVRGLPMIIFYKKGKRIDHFTTANINTIEEGIRDNS